MKILIFAKALPKNKDFIYDDIIGVSSNNKVSIFSLDPSKDAEIVADNVIKYNFSSFYAKINSFLIRHDLRLLYHNSRVEKYLTEKVDSFKPDIIQCHFGNDALFFLDNYKNKNIPIFIMFHGYDASAWIQNRTYINKYKRYFKQSNIIPITCSKNMIERMQAKGLNMTKAQTIHCGVDTSFFKRTNREKNAMPVFVQISVFRKKKGHIATIKAFSRYAEQNPESGFKLILAGDGIERNNIMKFASDMGLEEYVNFPGWVNQEEIKTLLNNADYYIHHSITTDDGDMEGIPVSIMEAMSMELPVISTFHSGIPELIENDINGILTNENDIEEYALAIQRIKKYGLLKKNRDKVIEEFEINKRIKSLQELFEKYV